MYILQLQLTFMVCFKVVVMVKLVIVCDKTIQYLAYFIFKPYASGTGCAPKYVRLDFKSKGGKTAQIMKYPVNINIFTGTVLNS